MDPVNMYLEAANCLLDEYSEISYFSEVFEGGDEKVQKAMEKNAEIEEKSVSLLQKAINGIKAIIKKIKEVINNMMEYLRADGSTKSAYQKFCDEVKNNPEFAGKKVSFKEYSKIAKQWDAELQKEEAQYRKLKDEELENKPSIANDLHEAWDKARSAIADKGKIVAKEVTVEYLLQEAKTCRDGAMSARNKLRWYETIIGNLENELGKKEARRVKRKLKRLSSRFSLVRKLAGGMETEYLTWKDALKNVFSVSGATDIALRNKSIRKPIEKVTGSVVGTAAHIASTGARKGAVDAYRANKKLTKYEKNHEEEIKKLKDVVNNKDLRPDQKQAYIRRKKAIIPNFDEDESIFRRKKKKDKEGTEQTPNNAGGSEKDSE